MSEVKALEELRRWVYEWSCDGKWLVSQSDLKDVLHAIEAEIAERFMELPVDADGVPIRVGDVMTLRHGKSCEVVAVGETQFTGKKSGYENCVCHANLHHHVKPRTVESLVSDFADEVWNTALDPVGMTYSDSGLRESEARLRAEIRELLGVVE